MFESIAILLGYLLGSIPFAYLVTRARKQVDIRDVDIGNAGAGSVIRVVGLRDGIFVLICDIGKGVLSVALAQILGVGMAWVFAAGLASVVGHVYPVFINFRGGQGAATLIGVFLGIVPKAMGLALAVMGIVLLLNLRRGGSRRLFFVVACGAPFVPLFTYIVYDSVKLALYGMVLMGFVIYRNRGRLRHPRTITKRILGETD
ncbi:MAG: glycerol-3-phosphate acyltransferase [Dehalococcoidia bacterium]|nr:glycerol-3-phosphate acyltransferase [Dehalococcoidia bacterium]